MKSSEFEISILVDSYNKLDIYDVEKLIVSERSKISIPNFNGTIFILESRLCQNFKSPYLILTEIKTVKERQGRAGSLQVPYEMKWLRPLSPKSPSTDF